MCYSQDPRETPEDQALADDPDFLGCKDREDLLDREEQEARKLLISLTLRELTRQETGLKSVKYQFDAKRVQRGSSQVVLVPLGRQDLGEAPVREDHPDLPETAEPSDREAALVSEDHPVNPARWENLDPQEGPDFLARKDSEEDLDLQASEAREDLRASLDHLDPEDPLERREKSVDPDHQVCPVLFDLTCRPRATKPMLSILLSP